MQSLNGNKTPEIHLFSSLCAASRQDSGHSQNAKPTTQTQLFTRVWAQLFTGITNSSEGWTLVRKLPDFFLSCGRAGWEYCWSNLHIDTFRMNESSDWSSSICLYFKYLKSSASTRPIKHTHYNRLWNCEARDFFFLLAKLVSWMTFFTHEETNIFHFREEILPKSFYYLILRMIYNFFLISK